jgi:peptidoglycan/LPS O-acetylase OafA/YrhL
MTGLPSRNHSRATTFAMLDPLRGLAALWVFTFHYQFGPWLLLRARLLAGLFHMGYLGVPLFFVISGYCITGSARSSSRRAERPTQFLYRRLRRIFPTFWFSLIFAIGMPFWLELVSSLKTGHFVPPAPTVNNGFIHYSVLDWFSILTLTRVFAHVPGAMSLQYKFTSLNAVYWTLALEVQFYVVVALALCLRKRFYEGLAAVTVFAIPFSLAHHTFLTGVFLPYWPMFAVGVLVYWLLDHGVGITQYLGRHAVSASSLAAVAGVAVFVAFMALHGATSEFIVAIAFGAWLLIAYPLDPILDAARRPGARRLWRVPLTLCFALGSMSYSLYLMHPKVFPVIEQPISQVLRSPSMIRDLLIIVLTCVATFGFYWFAERPFATSSSRRRVTPPSAPHPPVLAGPAPATIAAPSPS